MKMKEVWTHTGLGWISRPHAQWKKPVSKDYRENILNCCKTFYAALVAARDQEQRLAGAGGPRECEEARPPWWAWGSAVA